MGRVPYSSSRSVELDSGDYRGSGSDYPSSVSSSFRDDVRGRKGGSGTHGEASAGVPAFGTGDRTAYIAANTGLIGLAAGVPPERRARLAPTTGAVVVEQGGGDSECPAREFGEAKGAGEHIVPV